MIGCIQRHERKKKGTGSDFIRGAYEVDGSLDVLGDGGGALVLAGLVPVKPPHVVRLQGARVAPLVHQPPQPRVRRRRRRLPAASHSHGAIHLHHPRPAAAAGQTSPRAARQWRRGKAGDGGRRRWGFAFALLWFVYAATRGRRGREGRRRPLDGSEAAGSGVVVAMLLGACREGPARITSDRYALRDHHFCFRSRLVVI